MAESLQSSCPLPPCLPVTPTLTPLPNPGPNKGLIIGGVLATVAVGIVAAILLGRHGGGGLYLDAGAPLQMVLQFPLSLEVAKLPPPGAAAPGAQ
jgi:hypothetical protein